MKMFTGKRVWQKFLIALLTFVLIFQFVMPVKSYAGIFDEAKNAILEAFKELGENILLGTARITAAMGDLAMSALNNFMLGTEGFGTAMLSQEALDASYTDEDGNDVYSWFHSDINISDAWNDQNITVKEENNRVIVYVDGDYIEKEPWFLGSDGWEIPNLLYCPENIFGNNIAMLDVNFLNPNTYTPVVESGRGVDKAEASSHSIGEDLKDTVANWYKAFRNIAIVALLSVLVYLGIRILISSTAEDKAKYKETIRDWFIALCLVFAMHFIMAIVIMVVNQVNKLFVDFNNNIYVHLNGSGITFKSNFMGIMRFLAQSTEKTDAWAYTLIYWVLIFYTISFTIQYLKRVLYIAFYTMISPLVAITYPIDKLGDGKSQAFNKWFKEYLMTMSLQPIHLIIYTAVVSSALTLSIKSPLYAIVAIGFLIPAEQFIKSLFGVEAKADGFKGFTSGVLASKGLDLLKTPVKPSSPGGGSGGNDGGEDEGSVIRTSKSGALDSFGANSNNTPTPSPSPSPSPNSNNGWEIDTSTGPSINFASGNGTQPAGTGTVNNSGNVWDTQLDSNYGGDNSTDPSISFVGGNGAQPAGTGTGNNSGNIWDTQLDSNYGGDNSTDSSISFVGGNGAQAANVETGDSDENSAQQLVAGNANGAGTNEAYSADTGTGDTPRTGFLGALDKAYYGLQGIKNGASASNLGQMPKKLIKGVNGKVNGLADKIDRTLPDYKNRKIKKAVKNKYKGKLRRAKGRSGTPIRNMANLAAKGAGMAIAGTIGMAAGIASGKGVTGAATGLVAGVTTGKIVGNNIYNYGAKKYKQHQNTQSVVRQMKADQIARTEGEEAAIKYSKEHMSKAQKRRYDEILNTYTADTGQIINQDKQEMYNRLYDYESKGVTEEKDILQGLKMEYSDKPEFATLRAKVGLTAGDESAHKKVVDVMALTGTYGKGYITSKKNREEFDDAITANGIGAPGSSPEEDKKRENIKRMFYAAHNFDYDTSPK